MTTLYQELRALGDALPDAKAYHQNTRFPWLLALDRAGRPLGPLQPLEETQTSKTGKARTVRGVSHFTPSLKRTAGVSPLLPHDGIGYVLGWCDSSSKPDRVAQSHDAWAALVRDWATTIGATDPIAQALLLFLGHTETVLRPAEWTSKDNVLIQIAGTNAHDAATLVPFWTRHVEGAKSAGGQGTCLVCGHAGVLVDTLPQPVQGPLIPGGQTSGIAPISVNSSAFGYNLSMGLAHTPICTNCARAIPAALNHLLSDSARTERGVTTATTWWVTGDQPWDANPLLDEPQPEQVKALHESVCGATLSKSVDMARWNGLVLAANGPRMIVRDWTNLPLIDVQRNVVQWFDDVHLVPRFLDGRPYTPLRVLAMATGRHDGQSNRYLFLSDKAGHHFHEAAEILRGCALKGDAPPRALLVHVIARITSDQHIDDPRAALLRLILRRTYQRGTLMPGLEDQCTDPCYVAGRLFAIYGDMQYAAATMGGGTAPNSTFADKYLAGAISDPRTAITAGEKQAAAWLNKLRRGEKAYFFQRDLDAVMALLQPSAPLPTRASLDEQAMFILGYHHQRANTQHLRDEAKQRRSLAHDSNDTTTH